MQNSSQYLKFKPISIEIRIDCFFTLLRKLFVISDKVTTIAMFLAVFFMISKLTVPSSLRTTSIDKETIAPWDIYSLSA